MSVRSLTPPLAEYCATWVLPTSITSGASLLASAPMIFGPIPFHSWIWTLALMSGWVAAKSSVNRLRKSSETLPFISHTSMVVGPDAAVSFLSELPHAASAVSDRAATAAMARERNFIGSPLAE